MAKRRTPRQRKRTRTSAAPRYRAGLIALVPVGMLILFIAGLSFMRQASAPPADDRGLRITATGRSDASQVLDPGRFSNSRVRQAYTIAQEIPQTLNQLLCWCGCTADGTHRSALECFESTHAADCSICLANAEIAWEMRQRGITEAGAVQQELDRRFGRVL